MPRRVIALVPVLLLVVACSGSGGSGGSGGSANGTLPTATGSYGEKPTITFPSGNPSSTLQKFVLHQGTGAVVVAGDTLVANYLAQIWKGSIFGNSYDGHVPAGFPIGAGKVIPGFDEALVGAAVGSRVLLVVPPDKGYGSAGNSQIGVKPTDTLVFVVDVVASYRPKSGGDPHAVPQHVPAGLPKVTGALGKQPTVTVPKGTKTPTKMKTILLDKGTGAAVTPWCVVVQYVAVDWTGKAAGSTWQEGSGSPACVPIGNSAQPTPFDGLVGLPIGSRVLIEVPAKAGAKATTADAVAVDIVAQPPAA